MTSFYIFTVLLACCLSTHPYINALLRLRYATLCFWLRMEWGGVGWVEMSTFGSKCPPIHQIFFYASRQCSIDFAWGGVGWGEVGC